VDHHAQLINPFLSKKPTTSAQFIGTSSEWNVWF
jgi:hypothetical protein